MTPLGTEEIIITLTELIHYITWTTTVYKMKLIIGPVMKKKELDKGKLNSPNRQEYEGDMHLHMCLE